jgi:hypothetical protein
MSVPITVPFIWLLANLHTKMGSYMPQNSARGRFAISFLVPTFACSQSRVYAYVDGMCRGGYLYVYAYVYMYTVTVSCRDLLGVV